MYNIIYLGKYRLLTLGFATVFITNGGESVENRVIYPLFSIF